MPGDMEQWRKPLKPQEVPLKRSHHAGESLPNRSLRIKESTFLGAGSSGTVRAIEAELVRRPSFLKDPVGWFSPQTKEVSDLAIKIMRPGQVGEAMENYNDCKEAGITVPATYKQVELSDGRDAIVMSDLRREGYAIAQTSNVQAEFSRPASPMKTIENFDSLLDRVFEDALLASASRSYGKLLGGDSIFFLMPKEGGVGTVKHIFADFDRMHDQEEYHSTTLAPLQGNPALFKQEVARINVSMIRRKLEEFIGAFVDEDMQAEYLSKLDAYAAQIQEKIEHQAETGGGQ